MRGFFILLLFFFSLEISADPVISLRSYPVLVREGFQEAWAKETDPDILPGWTRIPNGIGKDYSLITEELKIPKKHNRSFLSLDDPPSETFSYLFRFSYDSSKFPPNSVSGFLFRAIGLRWTVYLNGELVDQQGLDSPAFQYNYLFSVPDSLVREGINIVLVKIDGPRVGVKSGFLRPDGLYFGDFDHLVRMQSEIIPIIAITSYILFGIFHLMLFLRREQGIHNLLFGLFSLCLGVFTLTYTSYITLVSEDSDLAFRIQAICFYLLPLLGILFFRKLFRQRLRIIDKILIPMTVCLIFAGVMFSYSWLSDSISLYKMVMPFLSVYVLFGIVGREFLNELFNLRASAQTDSGFSGSDSNSLFPIFREALFKTVAGNLFLGTLIFNILLFFDIADMLIFKTGVLLSQYGFNFFMLSVVYSLSNRFIRMSDRNSELNQVLNRKLKELEYSDQKYKFIVEGTMDLLFTMSSEYTIESMNHAARRYFGIKPDALIGKNFLELLYTTGKDKVIITQLVEENLRSLDSPGKQVRFRARIRSSRMQEPMELFFHLEAVDSGDRIEIIGKASRSFEEALTAYILRESQVYKIDNYILLADELSQRLVRVLPRRLPDYKIEAIRTGLREILVNAIEHGNLNITFEEKSQYLSRGDYLQLIGNRQKDPIYGSRKVTVHYELTDEQVAYEVTDEGEGFNYKELKLKAHANQSLGREHGRGIMLAENIFDEVEYLGKGNAVRLLVRFS
jgi:anti-sigma regulatory factor (Ser/Thr protein kinase)/PAS domain-containing protein